MYYSCAEDVHIHRAAGSVLAELQPDRLPRGTQCGEVRWVSPGEEGTTHIFEDVPLKDIPIATYSHADTHIAVDTPEDHGNTCLQP